MKSAREQLDIVSAYRELGSYRAAAALCGTTNGFQGRSTLIKVPSVWRFRPSHAAPVATSGRTPRALTAFLISSRSTEVNSLSRKIPRLPEPAYSPTGSPGGARASSSFTQRVETTRTCRRHNGRVPPTGPPPPGGGRTWQTITFFGPRSPCEDADRRSGRWSHLHQWRSEDGRDALAVERGALLDLPTQERRPGPR